jgi:hypothetical protein
VVGFCLLSPRFWNRCGTSVVENSILSCAKQQRKFNVLSKSYKRIYYHKLQVESLVQITFSNFQNSSKLYHELIRTSLTLYS